MNKSCETCRFKLGREEFSIKRCKKCSKTERAYYEPLLTAADIMVGLIEDGTYPSLTLAKNRKKKIESRVQELLTSSDSRRHEFSSLGYVAKFIPKKINKIDYEGMNEFLNDCGYLLLVVKIDHSTIKKEGLTDLFELYKNKPTYSLSVSFNKEGRQKKDSFLDETPLPENIEGLVKEYAHIDRQHEHFASLYDKAKQEMFSCEVLQNEGKLPHKYGSVYLKEATPSYDIGRIYEELGVEYLIKYGKPDSTRIQALVQRGSISPNDLNQFKSLVDVRLDFTLMKLESERTMLENYQRMTIQASQNRRRA